MGELGNYDIEKLKDLISHLENEETPLTKTKAKPVSKEKPVEQKNDSIEEKPKKGWTPTKQEAFKKMQEKRRTAVDAINRRKKLESAKVLLSELEIRQQSNPEIGEPKPKKTVKKQQVEPELQQEPDDEDDSNSSSSEEEIVIKKKSSSKKTASAPTDKKKKKKTIIIQSDSDDSDSDGGSPLQKAHPQREFKSARNKKSVIKVHKESFNPGNFFV